MNPRPPTVLVAGVNEVCARMVLDALMLDRRRVVRSAEALWGRQSVVLYVAGGTSWPSRLTELVWRARGMDGVEIRIVEEPATWSATAAQIAEAHRHRERA